jgi:MFS transporter, UMF1 family
MRFFDRRALNPGVEPREVFAWSMYDFANSGFTTVVLTAVFNAYFVGAVAGNAVWATFAWTAALAVSSALMIATMPAIGVWADTRGAKKRLLLLTTAGCVAATASLAWIGPGDVALAIVVVIAANWFFNTGESLAAAFLPELARPEALGRVSGWGWSLGYFGGMLALGLSLAWVLTASSRGQTAAQAVPGTMLITAAIFALAAVPVFAMLRERPGGRAVMQIGLWRQLALSWRESAHLVDLRRLLACGVFYQAGISVVIALAAIYAEQVMGFGQAQTMALIFVVNIASALGAFGFGYAQDRIGHRAALAVTLVGWIGMVLLAGLGDSLALFWMAAALAGLCIGSSQSCGRAMVGALAPADRLAETFGLWAMATRVSAIVGPLTYGLVTLVTAGNHRVAILCTGVFFVVGLVLLAGIDMRRGVQAAGRR